MASASYDVLIIGGGNAGFGVTVPTREAGLKVALVEERDLGGTCPNRGCTPKKVLVAAGHALHEISQAHVHGIRMSKPKLDWPALIDREKEMIAGIPDSLAETLEERGVDLFRESAHFVGRNEVQVGDRTIEALSDFIYAYPSPTSSTCCRRGFPIPFVIDSRRAAADAADGRVRRTPRQGRAQ